MAMKKYLKAAGLDLSVPSIRGKPLQCDIDKPTPQVQELSVPSIRGKPLQWQQH